MSSDNTDSGLYVNNGTPGSMSNHRYLDMMTVRPSQGARLTAASSIPAFNPATLSASLAHPHAPPASSSMAHSKALPPVSTAHITAQTHPLNSNPVLTVKKAASTHNSLLIEPILLPNLQHVHIDNPQDLEESCLFYPNGHKNRNIRREIESSVVKHHIIENNKRKPHVQKNRYRVLPKDPYANAKGPPLFYVREADKDAEELFKNLRSNEKKIISTVQVRI